MSLSADQESLHRLLFTHDLYANPSDEHISSNIKIRLAIVSIIMLFFLLLISSAVILIRTAPIDQSDSTTIFTTER